MAEKQGNPVVRRGHGTVGWTIQILVTLSLLLALVVVAVWKPPSQAIITVVISLVLGPLLMFMGTRRSSGRRDESRQ
ncbi:hypothetical protein [Arthrobacter sp. zg-Y1171]|uniref:hypothetical protein n=1 Tax=Arthrobacter sp. zg-Y1171 TaxID=2964610 RepID=UPI002103C453|nr:hypothetical protein [Arthrobacter sp. zg-Y1171]MCQ1996556.1 hypothetical protein [Arthrobacter sp. zg-Y1171]UWX82157.1 hypothetical protein N2L00_01565 [Arthrobacter sp. zg-Y1171]